MAVPALLDQHGRAIESRPAPRAGLSGPARNFFPYDAANQFSAETDGWSPWIQSPDNEINVSRDRMVARSRDLRRNDGWASGGITAVLDEAIGHHFRLSAQPDYRALSLFDKAFDATWAAEFKHAWEAKFRTFAEDPQYYCDAGQQLTFVQIMRLAMASKLVDGENLGRLEWMPERMGYGGAHYATAIRLIDCDRLSNPMEQNDTMDRRGGVEIDSDGVPLGYHIRRAHQNDWYGAVQSMQWDYVPRRMDWGRPVIFHDYDRERIDQHRGVPIYVPVMNRMKMLTTYDRAELQAAVINAIFSLSVTSPYDPEGMKDALNTSDGNNSDLAWYWNQRKTYRDQRPLSLQDARIMQLFPGEKAEALKSERPNAQHDPFTSYALRHVAAQLGTTAEKITKDWSKVNYSSARAGMLDALKTLRRRVGDFQAGTAMPIVLAVLEESMDRGELPMPKNAPDFVEARAAYSRCRFIGPGKGWIDPVKEAQAAVLRMDAGVSTMEAECAEQGTYWEEQLDQRQIEIEAMKKRGIPPPDWAKGGNATEDEQKPRPA